MNSNVNALLGKQPLPGEDQNLQGIVDAEDSKTPSKEGNGNKKFAEEDIINMMMNGDNSNGMFSPNEGEVTDDDLHEDSKENVDVKTGNTKEVSAKYKKALMKDMDEHPERFKIMTPDGEMTVKEALAKGYNPVTRKFEGSLKDKIDKTLEGASPQDAEAMKQMMDPSQLNLSPDEASAMGVDPNNPMVAGAQGAPMPGQPQPQPEGQPAAQPGQPDLAALLGGGGM